MGQIDDKQAQSFLRRAFEMGKENQLEYFAGLGVELTKHINREHLEPQKKEDDICIRCGLDKKTVKSEGSHGCYLYGDKMANKHLWKLPSEPQQEDKKIENPYKIALAVVEQFDNTLRIGPYESMRERLVRMAKNKRDNPLLK